MRAQRHGHHREKHRRRQHHAGHDPSAEVSDLRSAFFGLRGFHPVGSRLADTLNGAANTGRISSRRGGLLVFQR